MKTITKITFKETSEKFNVTQTTTGFDVKQIRLSKNVTPESWTFQEFLELYESGQITIDGFEETEADLIKLLITHHIDTAQITELEKEIHLLKEQAGELQSENKKLTTALEALQETE